MPTSWDKLFYVTIRNNPFVERTYLLLVNCVKCSTSVEKLSYEVKRSKSGNFFCSRSCSVRFNNEKNPKRRKGYGARNCCKTCKVPTARRFLNKKLECRNCSTSRYYVSRLANKVSLDALVYDETQKAYFDGSIKYVSTRDLTLGQIREDLKDSRDLTMRFHAKVRGYVRSWSKELLNKPCFNCSWAVHVELCHVKPIKSFGDEATLWEVNGPHNIVQLCPNCHWMFDNGMLELEGF